MDLRLRHYFGFAVLLLAVFCAGYGPGGDVRAQETINIFPANADNTAVMRVRGGATAADTDDVTCGSTGARQSLMACDVQQLVDMAGPGDTVIFNPAGSGENPNVYDDLGEVLITTDGDDDSTDDSVETITIRGMGSGDDMITFTGKVMFNVKASNIVIRNFKFMDTEIPDAVTVRSDDPETTGDQSVKYGFPGKTIRDYLAEEFSNWDSDDTFSPANIDSKRGFVVRSGRRGERMRLRYSWVNEPLVTVVGEESKPIADVRTGNEVGSTTSPDTRSVAGNFVTEDHPSGLVAAAALNAMGTVWVDSATRESQSCPADGILVKNVRIQNNVFDNTYLTGVRAGDHSYQGRRYVRAANGGRAFLQLPGVACGAQVEIVGNNFMNVGGNGPFLKESERVFHTDANGNKIAGLGNREAAISFYNVGSTGTTGNMVSSKITDNTIVGGTYDAIILASTPDDARVDITHNEIRDSILNGIDIVAKGDGTTRPTADIRIENNRIVGSSNNRFLTKNFFQLDLYPSGANFPKVPDGGSSSVQPPGDGDDIYGIISSCITNTNRGSTSSVSKDISAEVWKSSVPTFPFPDSGAPVPFASDSGNIEFLEITSTSEDPSTSMSALDIIRYRADECYDLGRIRVDSQAGVTIRNNDLGYSADNSGVSFVGSPKNGVVFMRNRLSAGVPSPKAFTGNNITNYTDFAVLNKGDAAFSAKDNYIGVPGSYRARNVSEVNNNGGTPFEGRMIGPRERFTMPDEDAPELVTSGDDAPAVDGARLTLTFDEMLDAMSMPAPGAFRVMAGANTILDVASVSISGMTVTLTLEAAAREGETITVAYTKPASNAIMDDAGNALESFTATAVRNNRTPAPGAASSGGGGCALASAGSGVNLSALVLLLGAASFAFGLGRKAKTE